MAAAGGDRTRGTYLPFGAGARVCIGERFALTEAVLALAAIAARWHLDPVPGSRVRAPAIVVMRPSGLRMRVRPRTAALATDTCGKSHALANEMTTLFYPSGVPAAHPRGAQSVLGA